MTILVVVASAVYVLRSPSPSTNPSEGPGIQISVDPASLPSLSSTVAADELENVTIQIFSVMPSSEGYAGVNLTRANLSSNPYLDELFLGTPSQTGVAAGNLSAEFYSIDRAWLATMSPMTQTVSLQLYATLSVTESGVSDQYTYFNNVPYNPRTPPADFSSSVYFPPQPTYSGPAAAVARTGISPSERPPPSCDPGDYWEPTNLTYISDGYVPLAIANAAGSPAGAQLSYGISYADTALELSFTSATSEETSTAYSGLQMSEDPSWSGTDTSFQGGEYAAGANSGGDPTFIGLSGAELTIWGYHEAVEYLSGDTCTQAWVNAYSTSVQLDGFESGSNFNFTETSLPAYFASLLGDMSDWTALDTATLDYGGSGIQFYTVLETAAGYDNAQDAEAQAETAFTTLDFALGAALLVCDVLNVIPGFDEVDSAPEALVVLGDVAGVAADLMNLFSTISFSTSSHTSIEQFGVDVNPAGAHDNLEATFYEASVGEQLSIGSSTYDPNMPLLYVDAT